jgi:GAF domain-containing protein
VSDLNLADAPDPGRREDARRQHEADLFAFVDIAQVLTGKHDLTTLLPAIVTRTRRFFDCDTSFVSLLDKDQGLTVVDCDGQVTRDGIGLTVPSGKCLSAPVLAHRAPFWTEDYLADQHIRHDRRIDEAIRREGLCAVMAAPMSYDQGPLGVLYVADRSVRHFTTRECSLLASIGDLVGAAVATARNFDEVTASATALEQRVTSAERDFDRTRALGDLHDELIELGLGSKDVRGLAETASRRLGGAVRIVAPTGRVLATAGKLPERHRDTADLRVAMQVRAAPEPVLLEPGTLAMPIRAGDDHLGTFLFYSDPQTPMWDRQPVRLAAQAAAVLLRSCRTMILEGQLRDELLDDLLTGSQHPQRLENQARKLSFDLAQPYLIAVAKPREKANGKLAVWASTYAHRMGGLKTIHNDSAVLMVPGVNAGDTARAISEELTTLLDAPVAVGGAGPVSGPNEILLGYEEAVRSRDALIALGTEGSSASAQELGFLGVLLSRDQDIGGFIESVIGPVISYDRQRLTDLTHTLDAYFEAASSPTHAAERLHVHPNTVARRLERITTLLGPCWAKPGRALDIQLALRLLKLRHALSGPAQPTDDRAIETAASLRGDQLASVQGVGGVGH